MRRANNSPWHLQIEQEEVGQDMTTRKNHEKNTQGRARRRIAVTVATLMAVATFGVIGANPASAALSDCGSGKWCMWASTGWNPNPPGQWGWHASNYLSSGWSNLNVGVYNNSSTGRYVRQYDFASYNTQLACTNAGFGNSNTSGQARYKDIESHLFAASANSSC